MKKKAWQMYRKRWKVPEILSLRIFPMRRIIEAGSGSRRCRKDISFPVQKTRRQSLFMRIIMNSMSRWTVWLDIARWHWTVARKKNFWPWKSRHRRRTFSGIWKRKLSMVKTWVQHRFLKKQSKTATSDSLLRRSSVKSEVNWPKKQKMEPSKYLARI